MWPHPKKRRNEKKANGTNQNNKKKSKIPFELQLNRRKQADEKVNIQRYEQHSLQIWQCFSCGSRNRFVGWENNISKSVAYFRWSAELPFTPSPTRLALPPQTKLERFAPTKLKRNDFFLILFHSVRLSPMVLSMFGARRIPLKNSHTDVREKENRNTRNAITRTHKQRR